jgi:predicted esterase
LHEQRYRRRFADLLAGTKVSAEPLAHLVRESADAPEGALVLLHSRGADEADLVPVLDAPRRTRVDYREHGGAHQIDPASVGPMRAWVRERVPDLHQ